MIGTGRLQRLGLVCVAATLLGLWAFAPPAFATISTTTSVTSSVNPSYVGESVTFTATVSPQTGTFDNGGTVQFSVDGNPLGSPQTLSGGQASISTSSLTAGFHDISANYSGDAAFAGSGGHLRGYQGVNQTANATPTTTSVTSSADPSVFGQSVTFTATVTPSSGTFDDGGTLQFQVDGVNLGSAQTLSGGQASISDSALSVGNHTIQALYYGDTSFGVSSGFVTNGQFVDKASTSASVTSSVNPSTVGQSVTFSATVSAVSPGSGTPTGHVQFQVDGSNVGSSQTLSGGAASISDSTLSVGNHTITATYGGDGNFIGNTGTLAGGQTVNSASASTSTSVSAPSSGTAGTAIGAGSISASLSGSTSGAGGTMSFKVFGPQASAPTDCSGGTAVGTGTTVSGDGTYNPSAGFTPSAAGTYWWYASYGGDSSNQASNSGCGSGMTSTVVGNATTPPDLSITNTGSPNTVPRGQQLTYTIQATNPGGQTATGVLVTEPMPANTSFGSASSTQGTCALSGKKTKTVSCNIGSLGAGATATITIAITPTKPGTLTATANATATNVSPSDTDDTATATTTVTR